MKQALRYGVMIAAVLGLLWACPFDQSLREYLSAPFWLPFAKPLGGVAKASPRRLSAPYAGMLGGEPKDALTRLRSVYPSSPGNQPADLAAALAEARSAPGLTPKEREEVQLLDAKIDMRNGSPREPALLLSARKKFRRFLQTAKTPEYRSEARGWIAYTHYLLGEQSAAGKIYLDELRRRDSNLSEETLRNSLAMTYGRDGGAKLIEQLPDYFDTAEHAAFAIQIATNARWIRSPFPEEDGNREPSPAPIPYARIMKLLEEHAHLLRTAQGANSLALLGMRTALRAGDPPAALRLAAEVPADAAARREPDFLWMLGAARFLAKEYATADEPLLALYRSQKASPRQRSAAAYGLCGVYAKTGNVVEQIRFALELNPPGEWTDGITDVYDQSIYLAASGFDRGLLLDIEAPVEALREFLAKYPKAPRAALVTYSLAVRMAREDQYEEAAAAYASIGAQVRAARMRRMAELYREIDTAQGKFRFARYLSENPDRLYFNDRLWFGFQTYALTATDEYRFTRAERERQIGFDRRLKDEQEERWRAVRLFREVVRAEGPIPLRREAALRAITDVRRLSYRFGRADDLREIEIELARWLRAAGRVKAG